MTTGQRGVRPGGPAVGRRGAAWRRVMAYVWRRVAALRAPSGPIASAQAGGGRLWDETTTVECAPVSLHHGGRRPAVQGCGDIPKGSRVWRACARHDGGGTIGSETVAPVST